MMSTESIQSAQSYDSAFARKVEAKKRDELDRINALIERSKEDPSAMLELSDIAYMQQRRRESISEGQ